MYAYIYIYIHICVYICIHIYLYIYIEMCAERDVLCMYVCVYKYQTYTQYNSISRDKQTYNSNSNYMLVQRCVLGINMCNT